MYISSNIYYIYMYVRACLCIYIDIDNKISTLYSLRTACKTQQKHVKQFKNIKPQLAVCLKRPARSQITKSRGCLFATSGYLSTNFETTLETGT